MLYRIVRSVLESERLLMRVFQYLLKTYGVAEKDSLEFVLDIYTALRG